MATEQPTDTTDRLVRALDARFAEVDTMVGARMVRWIEESRLDLNETRVLLALSETGRPMTVSEIAELSGLDLDSAYQAVHSLRRRRLTDEDSRRHELTGRGRATMRSFAQARREGLGAFVGKLDRNERRILEQALLWDPGSE